MTVNFESLCEKYYGKVKKLSRSFHRTTGIDETELQSFLNEELWVAIKDFNFERSQDISKWLNYRLKVRLIDFIRSKYITELKRWEYYQDSRKMLDDTGESEEHFPYEPKSETDIEEEYINRLDQKTKADKEHLISELIKDVDSTTTAIVIEYLQWSGSERLTPTAIGRKLGIHHEIVKRKTLKLAKRYNELQFGSIDAYLVV